MINIRRAIYLFSFVSLFLVSLTGCASMPKQSVARKPQAQTMHWLFVVSAPGAKLKYINASKAELVVDGNKFDRNIMFADRPYRYIHYITFSQLKHQWALGYNNFKNDPPNAVIAAPNLRPTIIKLTSYHMKGHMVYFTFASLQDKASFPTHLQRFMMMIDASHWWGCYCGMIGPIFPGQVGANGCKAPAGWKPPTNWKCNSNNTSCSFK